MRLGFFRFLLLGLLANAASGQAQERAEKRPTGPDVALEAIEPKALPVRAGLAGADPADIARYLLASGASGPALSPDGLLLAYRSTVTGLPQLWLVPTAGGTPRQMTFGNGITFYRWAPDGQSLVYGADNNGDEQESYFRISADGGRESVVLPAVKGGFRQFGDFAADGATIAFASTERNGQDFDIYIADLAGGASRLIYEGRYGRQAQSFAPDGSAIVVTETVGEDANRLFLLDVKTGALTLISDPRSRAEHGGGRGAWLADASGFYLSSSVGREFRTLMFYDRKARALQPVAAAAGIARDVEQVLLCGAGGRFLAMSENVDGFDRLHVIERATGRKVAVPALTEGRYDLSCAAGGNRLAVGINGWRTPGDVVMVDLDAGTVATVVASNMAGLDAARLVRPESLRMKARDGVEVQGLLYLPDAASRVDARLPPVIFRVHGGPSGQSGASFNASTQYYVDRGFAVFEPNVRGSTGFGRVYSTLDDREKRSDSVRDLIDMLDGLKADGRVDVRRAAVAGGSYGGYAVNAVLAMYPGAFKAGVSLYGVADWVTALQVASPALKASDLIEYGDIAEPQWLDFYTRNSPIRLADQIRVPVLFSHGVMDPRIDISETEVMVKTLRGNGVAATYVRFPDEGHGWRKRANQLFYYDQETAFLAEQLGQ
jgi:dipeptidyl aminopeptidase/acylaminoacyl peptidase